MSLTDCRSGLQIGQIGQTDESSQVGCVIFTKGTDGGHPAATAMHHPSLQTCPSASPRLPDKPPRYICSMQGGGDVDESGLWIPWYMIHVTKA